MTGLSGGDAVLEVWAAGGAVRHRDTGVCAVCQGEDGLDKHRIYSMALAACIRGKAMGKILRG